MMGSASLCFFNMEKINVFDVQVPDGRQIRCMLYRVIIYQFTPVHFDVSQPRLLPATPRPLPGSPPVTYFIGLEDSVFLTQISLCS